MKYFKFVSSAFLFVAVTVSQAWAGAHFAHEVAVSDAYIRGGLYTASGASDTKQYVGCYINALSSSSAVVCVGRDSSGTTKTCIDSSPNQAKLNAVAALSDSAYLYVSISNGSCERITVHANSAFKEQ